MSKNYLNSEVKEFIVIQLAEWKRPSDVAALVKLKFGIEIKRQTAHLYDPRHVAGKRLSSKLKALFYKHSAQFQKKWNAESNLRMQERIQAFHSKLEQLP